MMRARAKYIDKKGNPKMGLQDDITTLEVAFWSEDGTQDDDHALAMALAEMITRKSSKRLIWAYLDDLKQVLDDLGRYEELVEVRGIDPHQGMGA